MHTGAALVKNGMAITQNLITELQYSAEIPLHNQKKWKQGPRTDTGRPAHGSVVTILQRGSSRCSPDKTTQLQTALRRQSSPSATRMNAYGMRLNKINRPQEHQYHMVLYIRGNKGTEFKARRNVAGGMQREQGAESMCSVNTVSQPEECWTETMGIEDCKYT